MHPCKDILVCCSEDRLWNMVGLPKGDVLLTGSGHTDWLSACCFHPRSVHTIPLQPDSFQESDYSAAILRKNSCLCSLKFYSLLTTQNDVDKCAFGFHYINCSQLPLILTHVKLSSHADAVSKGSKLSRTSIINAAYVHQL